MFVAGDDPLASAAIRLSARTRPPDATPAESGCRPFGLRFLHPMSTPVRPVYVYSHTAQVAVGRDGLPLAATMGKDWRTKGTSDGDEGPKEDYGWEEQ
ncbi:MAG: putative ATP-grasp-modified RiPP [Actinomycetota bacterium]|nr:putative ATP-grasp-modified RiPP [Actinomycetota bacterium]